MRARTGGRCLPPRPSPRCSSRAASLSAPWLGRPVQARPSDETLLLRAALAAQREERNGEACEEGGPFAGRVPNDGAAAVIIAAGAGLTVRPFSCGAAFFGRRSAFAARTTARD